MREFLERERSRGRPMAAAFVVATEGSTYRKSGALMLFNAEGERAGLLSGGCLEGDLLEHTRSLMSGAARILVKTYDSRGSDDPIWGLGLGCEGLMRIALLRLDPENDYHPVYALLKAEYSREPAALAIDLATGESAIVDSRQQEGASELLDFARRRFEDGGTVLETDIAGRQVFSVAAERIPSLLLCGAGPDVEPVAGLARLLGWRVTVVDHRPAYLVPGRFASDVTLQRVQAAQLAAAVDLAEIDAAVVMSHHLLADGQYLAALAESGVRYVGLLGPAARRDRLFAELGPVRAEALRSRLRAPVGLDLGGRTPEAIALSIIAEIQAALLGRSGAPFHQGTRSPV